MATPIPDLHSGDLVTLCFRERAESTGTTAVTFGQMPATVGQPVGDSLAVVVPDEPNPDIVAVNGTVAAMRVYDMPRS